MGVRDTLKTNAAPFLHAGEAIQAVIPAQASFPTPTVVAAGVAGVRRAYRLIVATDQRIFILRRTFDGNKLPELLAELPRATPIGPAHSRYVWYRTDTLGERQYIHRRWFKDVAAADAAIP